MADSQDFTGKIALVTGGARNLGAAITRHLAGRGAHVIVNYFHATEEAQALGAELTRAGHSHDLIRASVAKHDTVDRMFDEITERHGALDILVNNAAAGAFLPLFEVDDVFWERAFYTNVMAPVWCAKRAAPLMRKRAGASITHLSSLGSQRTLRGYGAVGWTKAAVESLARYLAVELAPDGIRVNALLPGMIDNDVQQLWANPDQLVQAFKDVALLKRAMSNEETAELVGFLASDLASMMTGTTLTADCGALASPPGAPAMTTRLRQTVVTSATAPVHAPIRPSVSTPTSVSTGAGTAEAKADETGPAAVRAPATGSRPAAESSGIIAVVGVGAVLPNADSPQQMWQRLREGEPQFSEPRRFDIDAYWSPKPAPDRAYVRVGGFMGPFRHTAKLARELRTGDWPSDAPATATMLRHCAIEATGTVTTTGRDRWTCVTAVGVTPYGEVRQASLLGNGLQALAAKHLDPALHELAAHALASRYNSSPLPDLDAIAPFAVRNALAGLVPDNAEQMSLDSACASGLHAVDIAVKALREGSCDIALCSATCIVDPAFIVTFCKAQGLSPTSRLRPFESGADGTMIGEGAVSLTLKTLERAEQDGDRIFGLILGTGTSSDGKGKGIHAPAQDGQEAALRRAWSDAGIAPGDVDWVITHGTGTPLGDTVEIRSLRESLGNRPDACRITSNKAVFGHTALTAGLASMVHAMLALEHELIPRQPDFRDPHPELTAARALTVPAEDVPWPADPGRPRLVGVSAFGLGGSNAHIVLADHPPRQRPAPRAISSEDIVVVGWGTQLPGDPADTADEWLAGSGTAPATTFGDEYPLPSLAEIRIPPLTMRHMDRTHLMALQATRQLLDRLGADQAKRLSARTAVIGATMAPTRHYSRLLQRMSLDDCAQAFDLLPDREAADAAYEALRKAVLSVTRESTEDDFTGALPSATGRVANYFDLRGPNLVAEGGLDSGQLAIRTAGRLLGHHGCDLAVVCGASANTLPEWVQALAPVLPAGRHVSEGCVTIALARRSTALKEGLSILATVETCIDTNWGGNPALELPPLSDFGQCYPGIDALFAVPHSVLTGTSLDLTPATPGSPHLRIRPAAPNPRSADPATDEVQLGTLMACGLVDASDPAEAWHGEPAAALPEGTLVITNDADLAAAAADRPGVQVWTPHAAPRAVRGIRVSPEAAREHLVQLPFPLRHVRLLVSLAPAADSGLPQDALALQDLAFAAIQAALPVLEAGGSLAALVLGALPEGGPDPRAGLFDGLVRSVAMEVPQATCATVLSDTGDVSEGLVQLATEWRRPLPHDVIAYRGDRRMAYALAPVISPGEHPDGERALPLGPESVVVSAGGGRGITAEILCALAERAQPHIYVLGRTRIDDVPDGPPPERATFLRSRRAEDPRTPVRELVQEHTRWVRADDVRRNLARLRARCGTDKVRYLVCDILDEKELAKTADQVLARHDRIDLLINSVVELRSQATATKALDDFRSVRDTKVRGYHNLLSALAGRAPRIWCNFGTIGVLFGNPGDIDYVSASEYLNHGTGLHTPEDCREFTVLWPIWTGAGAAATPEIIAGFRKRGLNAFLPTEVGTAQFMDALSRHSVPPVLAYVRPEERDAIAHVARRTLPPPREQEGPALAPLVDQQILLGERAGLFTKTFSLQDGAGRWLEHHQVNATPVVPGIWVLEMAAEAAALQVPGLSIVGFRNLTCLATLTVNAEDPLRTIKIETTVLERDATRARARVRVDVRVHRRTATGRILRHDDLCHRVDVLLSDRHPSFTGPDMTDRGLESSDLTVPAYTTNTQVQVSGPLAPVHSARRGKQGITANFLHATKPWRDAFDGFLLPVLMLEGVSHLPSLPPEPGAAGHLGVLQGITEIDIAVPGNDATLTTRYGEPILLHTTFPLDRGQGFALAPDHTVLLRMSGISGRSQAVLIGGTGTVTPTTGDPGWWGADEEPRP
ncbi:SDR family oxidoreductase [Streptomyces albicerus]|uniref:SDR family oxidoreductase n=1 Tax=Streptomyces albicerus TaxID=2569859 RepID=UPI00124B3647|nr:SDR family oxidoreductase [Streptomyces albicerus]